MSRAKCIDPGAETSESSSRALTETALTLLRAAGNYRKDTTGEIMSTFSFEADALDACHMAGLLEIHDAPYLTSVSFASHCRILHPPERYFVMAFWLAQELTSADVCHKDEDSGHDCVTRGGSR